jgi:hypothetical protein
VPVQQPGDLASCAVCERTILPGERIAEYVAPDGERVGVCALCKPRAEASGWIPAEQAGKIPREPAARRRRSLNLRQRLTRASEAASSRLRQRDGSEEPGASPDPSGAEKPREPAAAPAPQRPSKPQPPKSPGRQSKEPLTRERLIRVAVDRFNSGQGPRKIAGLIRSLGEPQVAVRANGAAKALVTVAWEISWYQWEVAVDGESASVREVRKGSEVSELEADERGWNATASSDGTLRLGLAAAAADGAEGSGS